MDGADEVDPDNNMIKGMGAAMFKEKLNILNSPINYILIDQTKFVKELGEKPQFQLKYFHKHLNMFKKVRRTWSNRNYF